MKLAEALLLKSDLRNRVEQLQVRLTKNAQVQEGEIPGENPGELLAELDSLLAEYKNLTVRIYETNQSTVTGAGTLSDLLVQKERLAGNLSQYSLMAIQSGYGKKLFGNGKLSSSMNLHSTWEKMTEQLHQLEMTIQKLNWQTDLL